MEVFALQLALHADCHAIVQVTGPKFVESVEVVSDCESREDIREATPVPNQNSIPDVFPIVALNQSVVTSELHTPPRSSPMELGW
jgi:hypothetical protein